MLKEEENLFEKYKKINVNKLTENDFNILFSFYLNFSSNFNTYPKVYNLILNSIHELLNFDPMDYTTVNNKNGELCSSYPEKIFIKKSLSTNINKDKEFKGRPVVIFL